MRFWSSQLILGLVPSPNRLNVRSRMSVQDQNSVRIHCKCVETLLLVSTTQISTFWSELHRISHFHQIPCTSTPNKTILSATHPFQVQFCRKMLFLPDCIPETWQLCDCDCDEDLCTFWMNSNAFLVFTTHPGSCAQSK